MPDFGRLDEHLADTGHDGYLIDAAADDSDQRYLSGFDAPDPFFTLYTREALRLLVSELEFGRAQTESRADSVARYSEYDYADLRDEYGPSRARRHLISRFVDDIGVEAVSVPRRFPIDTADGLRESGITVAPDPADVVTEIRAVKDEAEIDHIRSAQRANEVAMEVAQDLIAEAAIEEDILVVDGDPLTAERVKETIEVTLLRHGCGLDDTIVASGKQGADPHERGHGPLHADQPIVIDIFPRNKTTKFHADMTRTVVRGDPGADVKTRHDVTCAALDAALATVEPGVTGADVHEAACDVYEDAGFQTLRSNPDAETGFIHSTGHGVGLDVHELPRVAPSGRELVPGHVITIEPGVYDPAVGGMRVEDLIVVTDNGYENLTDYPKDLVV